MNTTTNLHNHPSSAIHGGAERDKNNSNWFQCNFQFIHSSAGATPSKKRGERDKFQIFTSFQEDETVVGEVTSIEILANGTWVSKDKPTNGEIWDD